MKVPTSVILAIPFLLWHLAMALFGSGRLYVTPPANEPVEVESLTVLGAKWALTPFRLPFHEMLRVKDAGVSLWVMQETGLPEKVPFAVPLVMLTALRLVEQPDNWAFTEDGFVPPPEYVRRGEITTLAEIEQLIDPGARPL